MAIDVRNVSKSFNGFKALEDVSLSVPDRTANAHHAWWACGGLNWPWPQTSARTVKRPAGSPYHAR